MTPEKSVNHVINLVRRARDEEALAYWQRVGPTITDRLTPEQDIRVASALETAAMATDARHAAEVAAGASEHRVP
jgi:hypothetical protein